jgi:hypothetical protein
LFDRLPEEGERGMDLYSARAWIKITLGAERPHRGICGWVLAFELSPAFPIDVRKFSLSGAKFGICFG